MAKDEIEDVWEEEGLNEKVNRLVKNDQESNDEYEDEDMDRFSLNYYKTLMEKEEINEEEDDLDDPEIIMKVALDSSILAMKSELVKALTARKQSVLPLALQIFNKVQDQHVTTFRIDDFKGKGVDEMLLKCHYALDDSRSPVISGLIQTEHYVTQPLPAEFDEHYEDSDSLRTPIDLDRYQRDQARLEKLFAEVN